MIDFKRFLRALFWALVGIAVVCFALVIALNTVVMLQQNRLLHEVIPSDIDVLMDESAGDNEKLLSLILNHKDDEYTRKREEMAADFMNGEHGDLLLKMPYGFETNWYNVTKRCWDWGGILYIPLSFYKLPGQWWRFGSQVCPR